jgi:hypothetical protein
MKIEIKYGLPFVQLEVNFRGKKKLLDKVLLDTGVLANLKYPKVDGIVCPRFAGDIDPYINIGARGSLK